MTDIIDRLTLVGNAELKQGNGDGALRAFSSALKEAKKRENSDHIFSCSANLGALHIVLRNYQKGLEILEHLVPEKFCKSDVRYGDVYYNIGLAYEATDNELQALRYLELAACEYRTEKSNMESLVCCKLAGLYGSLKRHADAARMYEQAAQCFSDQNDIEKQIVSLCHQTGELQACDKLEEAISTADKACQICLESIKEQFAGRLFNELGLNYARCGCLVKAATCFSQALELQQRKDKKSTAVLLQNIGAISNVLGDFTQAFDHHKRAIKLHAQAKNRNAQGQCFNNMAYAYSQQGDLHSARDYYLHALQAADDTNDSDSKWQALEGLATIEYIKGRYNRSVEYLMNALTALSIKSLDEDHSGILTQKRLVGKLADSLSRVIASPQRRSSTRQDSLGTQLERVDEESPRFSRQSSIAAISNGKTSGSTSHRDCDDDNETAIKRFQVQKENRITDENEQDNLLEDYRKKVEEADKSAGTSVHDDDSNYDEDDDDDNSSSSSSSEDEKKKDSMPMHTAPQPQVRNTLGTYEMPVEEEINAKRKVTEEVLEDPLYSTITVKDQTLHRSTLTGRGRVEKRPSLQGRIEERPPPPPPRRSPSSSSSSSSSSNARQNKNESVRSRVERGDANKEANDKGDNSKSSSDDVALPTKRREKESKACILM